MHPSRWGWAGATPVPPPCAGLNNAVVFHERKSPVARARRYIHAFRSRRCGRGRSDQLETYYANVFFIEELRPGTLPGRVAILPINFHFAEHLPGYISRSRKQGGKRTEGSVFHPARQNVDCSNRSSRYLLGIFFRRLHKSLFIKILIKSIYSTSQKRVGVCVRGFFISFSLSFVSPTCRFTLLV